MKSDLHKIISWLYNSKLRLNANKSNFIIFYLKKKPINIFNEIIVQGTVIKRTHTTTYLVLRINSQLTWTSHINTIKSKIAPCIGVLRRTARYMPDNLSYNLYYSYIHSHLIYLIQIWGSASQYLLNDLQVLQNKALKAIRNLPADTPSKVLFNEKILPINKLVEFEYVMTIYKIHLFIIKCNVELKSNFQLTDRITRGCFNFRLPNYKLTLTQNSIFYKGIGFFNKLKDFDKSLPLPIFKSTIKEQLIKSYMQEYESLHSGQ